MVVVVRLVIALGFVELGQRRNFRHDPVLEVNRGSSLRFFGGLLLRLVVIQDDRPVLRADISPWRLSVVGSCASQNTSSRLS